MTVLQPGQAGGVTLGPTRSSYNDDIITGWVGVGSQIDGLGHLGIDNVYYNCNKAGDFAKADGLTKLGIEKVPPFVTRGVVLDMTAYFEPTWSRKVRPSTRRKSTSRPPSRASRSARATWCCSTPAGRSSKARTTSASSPANPGSARKARTYLASKGVVAIGADQWALEVIPFEKDVGVFEIHQILLARNGVYILENMNTAPLVADKAWEFMFVLGAARITGAVQGIINPVAIR